MHNVKLRSLLTQVLGPRVTPRRRHRHPYLFAFGGMRRQVLNRACAASGCHAARQQPDQENRGLLCMG